MGTVRTFLIRTQLIPYKCDMCGNTGTWNGKKLSIHLDHIDGNRKNNQLSNLRWLCPNCHAQTETYGSKNIKTPYKRKNVKESVIINAIKNSDTISGALKKSGLPISGLYYEKIKNIMDTYNLKLKVIPLEIKIKRRYIKRLTLKCKSENCDNLVRNAIKTGYCWSCYNKIAKPKKVKNRPNAQTLLQEAMHSSMLQVGKKYGVSDNAIRKWLKSYGLPHRSFDLKKLVKVA